MSPKSYSAYKQSGVAWLGAIPQHWGVGQSRRAFQQRKERLREGDIQLTASQKYGVISQKRFMEMEGQKVTQVLLGQDILKHVERGDFVISMRSFQGGIELAQETGCISSAYVILMPGPTVDERYFAYLLKSVPYIQALQSTTNLVRDGQALRFENFTLVDLPMVPLPEQTAIATFLDRETAKIDALVEEKKRLIDLLKEMRQAVISHAVTKGLNPDVRMKDSGIEWLGEVPEHWELKRLKDVKAPVDNAFVDGPFGSNLKSEHFIEGGAVYVIESSFATQGELSPVDLKTITSEHFETIRRSECKADDIIIAKIGAQFGKASILPQLDKPSVVSGNSLKLTVNTSKLSTIMAYWQLVNLKTAGAMDIGVNGSAQPALSLGDMNNLPMLVPPPSEQTQIVDFLTEQMQSNGDLRKDVETAIEVLSERRSALISAAVTGRIDVQNLAHVEDAA